MVRVQHIRKRSSRVRSFFDMSLTGFAMSSSHLPVADADLVAAVDFISISTSLTAIEPFNAAANYGKEAALRDSKTAILGQETPFATRMASSMKTSAKHML